MPSSTKKQADFMKAIANNPKFAKKTGVPQKVGKDFSAADKRTKKFAMGGDVAGDASAYPFQTGPTVAQTNTMPAPPANTINVGGGVSGTGGVGGDALGNQFPRSGFKSGGKVSSASKRADGCAIRGKTRA
jgi:hypothetical protein